MTPEEVQAMRSRYRRRCELLELQLADARAHVALLQEQNARLRDDVEIASARTDHVLNGGRL